MPLIIVDQKYMRDHFQSGVKSKTWLRRLTTTVSVQDLMHILYLLHQNSQKGQSGKIKDSFDEDPKLMAQLQMTLADLDAELAGKVLNHTGITHEQCSYRI